MKAGDRMQHHDAVIDPASHQVQQTIYLAQGNPKPRDESDYFEILSSSDPETIRADATAACKLETYETTPNYDQGCGRGWVPAPRFASAGMTTKGERQIGRAHV